MFTGYRTIADIMGSTEHTNATMIAHATVEYESGEDRVIRYQDTDILRTLKSGHQIINSDGYRTPTTQRRINQHLKYGDIYQDKSVWYYNKGNHWTDSESVVFYDGMQINSRGTVVGRKPNREAVERKTKALKAKIAKFVKLLDSEIPRPANGDCLNCRLFDSDGKPAQGTDHLSLHMEEDYLHGTLLVNAMREAGYEDKQLPFHYMLAEKGSRDFFKRALRKYLYKRLREDI